MLSIVQFNRLDMLIYLELSTVLLMYLELSTVRLSTGVMRNDVLSSPGKRKTGFKFR
jgi:hypothetical protein